MSRKSSKIEEPPPQQMFKAAPAPKPSLAPVAAPKYGTTFRTEAQKAEINKRKQLEVQSGAPKSFREERKLAERDAQLDAMRDADRIDQDMANRMAMIEADLEERLAARERALLESMEENISAFGDMTDEKRKRFVTGPDDMHPKEGCILPTEAISVPWLLDIRSFEGGGKETCCLTPSDTKLPYSAVKPISCKLASPQEVANTVQVTETRVRFKFRDQAVASSPLIKRGTAWRDPDFTPSHATKYSEQLDWKRPMEIFEKPILYSKKGCSPFDIDVGGAGNSTFLTILLALKSRRNVLKDIVMDDAYLYGTMDYDGIFRCRFWRFGRWENIFIDDMLPCYKSTNTLWGTSNRSDPTEMWAPLVEKAYAKFQGSYEKAITVRAGEAFLALTGGNWEVVRFQEIPSTDSIMRRLYNALSADLLVATTVRVDIEAKMGLKEGHPYQLTSMMMNVAYRGEKIYLLCVRNPQGVLDFTGELPEELIRKITTPPEIGEFWVTPEQFLGLFSYADLCGMVPDVNIYDSKISLDKIIMIRGEWVGPSAAGTTDNEGHVQDNKMFNNPTFTFTLGKDNIVEDGPVQLVLQMFLHKERDRDLPNVSVCPHLFKIIQNEKRRRLMYVLVELTKHKVFTRTFYSSFRYDLDPGEYMLIPSTMLAGQEEEFMMRLFIFSPGNKATNIRYAKIKPNIYLMRSAVQRKILGPDHRFLQQVHLIRCWMPTVNSGGQIRFKSFEKNPQILLNHTDKKPSYYMISLKQELEGELEAIGFIVIKAHPTDHAFNYGFLSENYRKSSIPELEGRSTFVRGSEADGIFELTSGYYVIVVFPNNPDTQKEYCLSIYSDSKRHIQQLEFNTVDIPGGVLDAVEEGSRL